MSRKLKIFSFVSFLILAIVPSDLCMISVPIIYVSGDETGDFNCNATDADVQINQALQLVVENSNCTTVYLKGPFTYVINDTLVIGNNTTLAGDSSATIKLVNNANWKIYEPMIEENSSGSHDITIRGFTIDGNREGNTNVISGKNYYDLIHLSGCQNINVCDMYLTNNHGDGLKTDFCSNIKLYNNTIYELGHDALYAITCSDVEAYNNTITCRTNSGLRLYNTNNASFHDNVITSNNGGGAGIEIQKYGTPAMDNIEVYNNIIYRTALAGIWIFGSNSYPASSANVHIHHNQIYDTGTRSSNKVIGGILSAGFNALIENNVIDGAYGAGIVQNNVYSPAPAGSGYVITARNNIITNTGFSSAGGSGYGIYNLLTGTHSFVLQNNCFYNNIGGDHEGVQASPSNIESDPAYADRSNNDYHLKSEYGHWNESRWVTDNISSTCIDAGYAFSDYSNEPEDNGDRINIGAYGNTMYASKAGTSISNNEQAPAFTEIQISKNELDQSNPAIYGDKIVWDDNSNGNPDICMYDLSTSRETQITTNESYVSSPAIYGDRIVWDDNRSGNSDIYIYNISTSAETQITANESWKEHPAIYGNRIVWQDWSSGNSDIYMYDLSNSTETQITTDESDQVGPAIYGDMIVWQDSRNGNWDIYTYNLSTSRETRIDTSEADQIEPAIYGDIIVWQDSRNGNWDIYTYNLSTSRETRIDTSEADQIEPAIYGDRIVWQDFRNENSDIYMYTISTSNETQITINESRQGNPVIYGNRIVWDDGRNRNSDIYMCTVTGEGPEPKKPVANFSTNITSGYAPLSVQFTDGSENANGVSWDFENKEIVDSTDRNPVYVYTVPGSYTVNLTAINANGSGSKFATITVLEKPILPVANFNTNVNSGYAPLSVQFTDLSQYAVSRSWDFNSDGITDSNDLSPVYTYITPGTHTVSLKVINVNGTNSKTAAITVLQKPILPVADFSTSVTSGYAPLSVQFTDLSQYAASRSWDFNSDRIADSSIVSPVYTYITPGTYTANLKASNANGTNSKTATITVLKPVPPVASFSSNVVSGYAPLNVLFTDTSTNTPTSWNWNFGDGTTNSAQKNPAHTYSKAGSYALTLTVSNAAGSTMVRKTSYITATTLRAPIAALSANVTSGTAPLTILFSDKSTGSPASWSWSFGDGTSSIENNPVHTYGKAGRYTVRLTIRNAAGSNAVTRANYIAANALKPPVAALSATPTSGNAPLEVTFTDRSTGSLTSWSWSFGDGTYSTEKNPVHTYSKAGRYTVRLTVRNAAGSNTVTRANYIVANALKPPVAAFLASPTSGNAPLKVTFTDTSTGSPNSWRWVFGDENTSTQKNTDHTSVKPENIQSA